MTVAAVVPSYHRPDGLDRCLLSLTSQSRAIDEIVVVARLDDQATHNIIRSWIAKRSVVDDRTDIVGIAVDEPGVIAAMSAGVAATTANIVAFTDDDAGPRPDWIGDMLRHFADRSVGGVGGRDVLADHDDPLSPDVGRFTSYGKLVGNHDRGCGPPRSVDVLKGVNMAYRAEALALPRAGVLRGSGAQRHFEVLVCGHAQQHGWRLIYDPELLVDHEIGRRSGIDDRWRPHPSAVFDTAFNSTLSTGAVSRSRPPWPALYGVLVGSRGEPGLVRLAAAVARREGEVVRRAPAGIAGHALGVAYLLRGVELAEIMVTATQLRAGRSNLLTLSN